MLTYFPLILWICRKNEEYAERNFHFQQYLGNLGNSSLEKSVGGGGGYILAPRMKTKWTVYKLNFLVIFKKIALYVYEEYAKRQKIKEN